MQKMGHASGLALGNLTPLIPQELAEGMEAMKADHVLELQLHKNQLSAAVSLLPTICLSLNN